MVPGSISTARRRLFFASTVAVIVPSARFVTKLLRRVRFDHEVGMLAVGTLGGTVNRLPSA